MIVIERPVQITRWRMVNAKTQQEIPEAIVNVDRVELDFVEDDKSQVLHMVFKNLPIPPMPLFMLAEYEQYKKAENKEQAIENRVMALFKEDMQAMLQNLVPRTLDSDPNGPGTILSGMLSSLGIKSTPNCSCRRRAIHMNKMGPDWCEENLGTILGWLREEATRRKLPFVEMVAKMILKKAISKSRRLLAKTNEPA